MLYCCYHCKLDIETSLGDSTYECDDKICKALDYKFCSEKCRSEHILYKCNVQAIPLITKFKLYLLKNYIGV